MLHVYTTYHGAVADLFGNGGLLGLGGFRLLCGLSVLGRVAQRRRRSWMGRHTVSVFLVVAALTLASVFLTAALTYATLSACD